MNLKDEKYILTIIEEGSVSKAANKLYISQPALSQAITQIENKLGIKIFEKIGKNLYLTEKGEKYLEFAQNVVSLEENLYDDLINHNDNTSKVLKFGVSTQVGTVILPNIINDFQKIYPNIQLDLTIAGSANLEKLISEKNIDIAISNNLESFWNIKYDLLNEDSFGILAGSGSDIYNKYENNKKIDINETKKSSYVFLAKGHTSRERQDNIFEACNITIKNFIELDNFEIAKKIAINCGRVMLCPYSLIKDDLDYNIRKAHFYPLIQNVNSNDRYIIYRKNRKLPDYMIYWISLIKNFYK